jgi:hypothetical protein
VLVRATRGHDRNLNLVFKEEDNDLDYKLPKAEKRYGRVQCARRKEVHPAYRLSDTVRG